MHENSEHNYSSTCHSLESVVRDLEFKIRLSEQNRKLAESYQDKIKTAENNIVLCNSVIDVLKPMLADVQDYIAKRKKESMNNINNAIRIAGDIVQDATEGIYFKLEGDEAWIATPDDLEVDTVEGGGYRQISSSFLRTVVLQTNPELLNTVFLDEVFSLVSPENSAKLSLYLNVMSQTMQIVSIEQKPQVYSNVDTVTYTFSKGEEYAEVKKQEIKHGGIENAVQTTGTV